MVIKEIKDHAALAEIVPAWADLAERVPSKNPFMLPAFLLVYLEHLGPMYRYRVLTAWDGNRLLALAPIFQRSKGKLGVYFRRLSFPVDGTSPPFDFLIDGESADLADALASRWRESRGWDLIELEDVLADSPTVRLLSSACEHHDLHLTTLASRIAMYVPITGTWDEYWMSLSKNVRHTCRRAKRRCEKKGATRIARYPEDGMEVNKVIEMMSQVIEKSWKATRGRGDKSNVMLLSLARALASENLLDVRFVTIDGQPVAYIMNIDYRKRFNAFHTAYNLDYLWHGPTALLHQDSIRAAYDRGYERYDLHGGRREEFTRWTEYYESHVTLHAMRPDLVSRVKWALYRRIHQQRVARAKAQTTRTQEAAKISARNRNAADD